MLRNREFRKFALLFILMTAIDVLLGFIISLEAGILATVSSAAYGSAFFLFTKTRYKNIAKISNEIDLVLHNADYMCIADFDEGELSILHSEITKMALRIREQNKELKKEKKHLADSLADIAHQLRTPLTSANLILSLLATNPDETHRKAFLREIGELFEQMNWLITSLLKLSRLDAGIVIFQCEQIDLNSLIHTALRPLLISMELHNISLQIDVPKDITIQGDLGWLSEAFQNIIKNCIESTGENGEISISCQDNSIFTEISINDSGSGFEKEDLPYLFDRFYRGKSSNASGYGIGLALCKMIITQLGGSITAKNHHLGGAVFAIRFPK